MFWQAKSKLNSLVQLQRACSRGAGLWQLCKHVMGLAPMVQLGIAARGTTDASSSCCVWIAQLGNKQQPFYFRSLVHKIKALRTALTPFSVLCLGQTILSTLGSQHAVFLRKISIKKIQLHTDAAKRQQNKSKYW